MFRNTTYNFKESTFACVNDYLGWWDWSWSHKTCCCSFGSIRKVFRHLWMTSQSPSSLTSYILWCHRLLARCWWRNIIWGAMQTANRQQAMSSDSPYNGERTFSRLKSCQSLSEVTSISTKMAADGNLSLTAENEILDWINWEIGKCSSHPSILIQLHIFKVVICSHKFTYASITFFIRAR